MLGDKYLITQTKSVKHQAGSDDERHQGCAILQADSYLNSSMSTDIKTSVATTGQVKDLVNYDPLITRYYYRCKLIQADHPIAIKLAVVVNNSYVVISNTLTVPNTANSWFQGTFTITGWQSSYRASDVKLIIYGGDSTTTFGRVQLEQQSLTSSRYDYLTAPLERAHSFKYWGYYYDELDQPSPYAQSYLWNNRNKKAKGLILGDSLAFGVAGWYAGGTVISNILMPNYLDEHTEYEWENAAIGGTEMAYGENSMIKVMGRYNLADYQQLIVMYGTNDFNLTHETLNDVTSALSALRDKINWENPKMKVLIITPIETWDQVGSQAQPNRMGFSQNQLIETMIKGVKNYYQWLDWRSNPIVTAENRWYTLGDGTIHPTSITYLKMFRRILKILNNKGE